MRGESTDEDKDENIVDTDESSNIVFTESQDALATEREVIIEDIPSFVETSTSFVEDESLGIRNGKRT